MSTPEAIDRPVRDAWRTVDTYFSESLSLEDPALEAARISGARTTLPGAEVTAAQGALLHLLATSIGARRILEFGTLAGYSTIWLARAVGDDGTVVTLELEEQNAQVARANLAAAGVADRATVLVGPALESARALIADSAEPFDLVFIDADKPSNPDYLAAAH